MSVVVDQKRAVVLLYLRPAVGRETAGCRCSKNDGYRRVLVVAGRGSERPFDRTDNRRSALAAELVFMPLNGRCNWDGGSAQLRRG
jgi:hypothetical protein